MSYVDNPRASAPGGAADISETEIDFGTTGVRSKTFTVTDAAVTGASNVIATQSFAAATGKSQDENEMDQLSLRTLPGSGQFTLFAEGLCGSVYGAFNISYLVG